MGLHISGFSDEISATFVTQLQVVKQLGMEYISLRTADKKNIADFTVEEVKEQLIPLLNEYGIKVSSLGSPIGKIKIDDEEAFEKQLVQLDTLCQICHVLDCKYIRMFSFYYPEHTDPSPLAPQVIEKLKKFASIAEKYDVILIHENEKDVYGDIAKRCLEILEGVNSNHFKAVFDFANFVQCQENTMDCYNLLKDYIVYIHIKDAVSNDKENVLCGTGEGQIKEILKDVIQHGYQGFLTLEPHLVLFDALASLEITDAKEVIKVNKYKDGADGYKAQYEALQEILKEII